MTGDIPRDIHTTTRNTGGSLAALVSIVLLCPETNTENTENRILDAGNNQITYDPLYEDQQMFALQNELLSIQTPEEKLDHLLAEGCEAITSFVHNSLRGGGETSEDWLIARYSAASKLYQTVQRIDPVAEYDPLYLVQAEENCAEVLPGSRVFEG